MTAFPPLADRPDDADAILEENDAQASPAVLDLLKTALGQGLVLNEYLQLASLALTLVIEELCEMIQQGTGAEDSALDVIECATLLGRLQTAEEIIDSIDFSEDEEAGEDD